MGNKKHEKNYKPQTDSELKIHLSIVLRKFDQNLTIFFKLILRFCYINIYCFRNTVKHGEFVRKRNEFKMNMQIQQRYMKNKHKNA